MNVLEFPRLSDALIVRQFAKYGIVGVLNTVIGFGLYVIFVKLGGIHYLLASALGYAIGAINSYMLNRHWTFRAGHISHLSSAPRFALVQGFAIAGNLGLLYLFVHVAGVEKIAAQAVATVIVLSITFVVNRLWSFAHRGEHAPGKPLAHQVSAR
jgi:putative flippase GtrA